MIRISINLLPVEFAKEQLQKDRFYKIQAISIIIILIMIFLASLAIALRLLQSHNITQVQARLNQAQSRVSDLKDTQASLLLLKNRLNTIDKLLNTPSKQAQMYKLLNELIPAGVKLNAVSVDKTGEVKFAATVDAAALEILMDNLTIKENNQGKIAQVAIDTINRGREGNYRVDIKIKPR